MTKLMLLLSLHGKLSNLPNEEVEERLKFYSEMIEDRMEEGLSEEEAVAAVGTVDEIVAQIEADLSVVEPTNKNGKTKRRLKVWEIVLLVIGSPIWVSLGIAAAAVILSLYISLWSVIISLWAVFASMIACGIGGIVAGVGLSLEGNVTAGIAMIGAAIACVGFSIFLFFGCKIATNGTLLLTKKIAMGIKMCFTRKEDV